MKTLFTILFACATFIISAQETRVDSSRIFEHPEVSPSFPGGEEKFNEFFQLNIKYPKEAKDKGIEGKVIVTFTVFDDGSIGHILIEEGIGYGCDEEVMRLMSIMPKWNPATIKGHKVSAKMRIPVTFSVK